MCLVTLYEIITLKVTHCFGFISHRENKWKLMFRLILLCIHPQQLYKCDEKNDATKLIVLESVIFVSSRAVSSITDERDNLPLLSTPPLNVMRTTSPQT